MRLTRALQLSHVPMNVETRLQRDPGEDAGGVTSIEPRSYERGNLCINGGSSSSYKLLQLSHVPMNVETYHDPSEFYTLHQTLQLSHVPMNVETRAAASARAGALWHFN